MTRVGDHAPLEAQLRALVGTRHPVVAAATVTPERTSVASIGADPDADFEIGSISKGVTGMLFTDAAARGEVSPSTTLGELLPLRGTAAAGVTLAALATHRSGLPPLPRSAAPLRRTVALWRHGTNPYGEDLPQLLRQAESVALRRPRFRYSNFGFELLGHAVASAAGTTYRHLVHERLATPLGMANCYVPATPAELRPGALTGRSRSGRPRQPWTGEAIGPAGGIRASIGDMARLLAALLDGSAPGVAALKPVGTISRHVQVGAAWLTVSHQGRQITWHNGGTGGFRSWLGVDRAAGTGAVVMSATSSSVDRHGSALLVRLSSR